MNEINFLDNEAVVQGKTFTGIDYKYKQVQIKGILIFDLIIIPTNILTSVSYSTYFLMRNQLCVS